MRFVSLARDTPTGPKTVWELTPVQDFGFRGDIYLMKTVRVVALARETPTGPPLRSYQILSKYIYGYQSYRAHKDASTHGRAPC